MTIKTLISVVALTAALGAVSPVVAQDHIIGGVTVAADQVEAVQAKCDELRSATADATNATEAPADTAATEAPAADAAADTATTETPAADATAGATTDAAAAGQIDLATLTVEQCDEGGFAAPAP